MPENRYSGSAPSIQPVQSNAPQLFASLTSRLKAFSGQQEDELDREMAKKARERGLIDAQGKTEITLRDGSTIADEAWNAGAISSHLAAIKLDITENITRIADENPDPEAIRELAKGYSAGLLKGVPEKLQPIVGDELASTILDKTIKAERNLRTAQHNERKVTNGAALDLLRAQALDAADSFDLESATKYQVQSDAIIDAMVADKTITAAEAAKGKLSLKDDLDSQIIVGEFKKALDAGKDKEFLDKFAHKKMGKFLDPDKREKLLSQMLTLRYHREAITGIKRDTGRKEIKAYVNALGSGFSPSKAETSRVTALANGAGLGDEFTQAVDDIEKVAYYAKATAADRRAKIEELGASGDIDDFNKWDSLKKADARITKDAQDDGYALAIQQGVIEPTPIDYKNPESFKARAEQAKLLSKHYGVEVSPFADQEVKQLVEAIPQMTPQEQTITAMSIGAMGNSKMFYELTKKNAPVFAMVAAIGVPEIAETIFTGQAEIDAGNVMKAKPMDYAAEMDDYLGGVYAGGDKEAIRKAALAHYAATNGNNEYDSALFKKSLEAVTGGVAKINGFAIELPRGVDESTMEDFIDHFSPDAVKAIGGVDRRSDADAAGMIKDAEWISIGANRYIIRTKFGDLMQNNKPLVISYSPDLYARPMRYGEAKRLDATRKERRDANTGVDFAEQPARQESFGTREDGTEKQAGFFGLIPTGNGDQVMSEKSIGVEINGEETLIPAIVPTMTAKELEAIKTLAPGAPIPKSILKKAVAHAMSRMKKGKSPFWEPGDKVHKAPK